jgi:hypothetical protein
MKEWEEMGEKCEGVDDESQYITILESPGSRS